MPSDDDLVRDVKDEIRWDPRLDPATIAVSVKDGRATLRGTVGSLLEKREATKAAERIFGVVAVHNKLEVRLLNEQRREDADLRADVLQALMLNSAVPKTVDVKVKDGLVTLTGTANWQYQRAEAEQVAENVVGALDVVNHIELKHPQEPVAADVEKAIQQAFRRMAALDANDLHVSIRNGTVTIRGTVRSWAEHDDALAAVAAAPGVVSVRDHIRVSYV
jgi:osmotically-inducible protein OsmY